MKFNSTNSRQLTKRETKQLISHNFTFTALSLQCLYNNSFLNLIIELRKHVFKVASAKDETAEKQENTLFIGRLIYACSK